MSKKILVNGQEVVPCKKAKLSEKGKRINEVLREYEQSQR